MDPENIEQARKEMVELLGEDGVNSNLGSRIAHSSTEWSPAPRGELDRPAFIVYPKQTQDVSELVKICHRRKIPMIGYAGGTSLEGTLAAIHGEVCVDFSRMNRVVALHQRDMDVVVQPGVSYEDLNEILAKDHLFFPPDPGPGACIGGMISQGCSGTNAYRYGTVRDWVLGLTVVLPDGTIVKTRHRPRKSSAGYNMTQLFVGSEGTLGFITEASLKVTNKPENVHVAVASFPTTQAAVDTVVKIVQKGMQVGALEIMDAFSMRAVNNGGYCDATFDEAPTLFLKFSGSHAVVREQMQEVHKLSQESRCLKFEVAKTDAEADALWKARKTVLWSLMTLKRNPDDKFVSSDVAVPISRLADLFERTKEAIDESGLVANCLGHAGDGNFHAAIFYSNDEKENMDKLMSKINKDAIEMEGTVTGEHGIGLEKRDALIEELGVESVDMMRQIKHALDPMNLMNPEKMIRTRKNDQDR